MVFHDLVRRALKGLIATYAYLISPLTGPNCRFYPTCSRYAAEAIDTYGAFKGSILAIVRILKCHPWYKGAMIDPVPEKIDWLSLIGYKRRTTPARPKCGCDDNH